MYICNNFYKYQKVACVCVERERELPSPQNPDVCPDVCSLFCVCVCVRACVVVVVVVVGGGVCVSDRVCVLPFLPHMRYTQGGMCEREIVCVCV